MLHPSALAPLLMTTDIPVRIAPELDVGRIAPFMGPYALGSESVQTISSEFATVVNYRIYRLTYTTPVPLQTHSKHMLKYKTQIDGLYLL